MKTEKKLSKEAKRWQKKLILEYAVSDQGGLLILQVAMESFDRMRDCQAIIQEEGPTTTDRFKQQKAHPLCAVERDSRSALLMALKSLNLDLEPLHDTPGRPTGT